MRITRDGDAVVYSWSVEETTIRLLGVFPWLFGLLAALRLPLFHASSRTRERHLRLERDALEVDTVQGITTKTTARVRAQKGAVGAVFVGATQLAVEIDSTSRTIDGGKLSRADLESLAAAIRDWKGTT